MAFMLIFMLSISRHSSKHLK